MNRFTFAAGPANTTYIDDLEIKSWTGSAYTKTEHLDDFSLTSGASAQNPTHDAAGNLTFDGVYAYTYDAWNRLVEIKRAYYNAGVQTGSTISTIAYDATPGSRRISKSVTNSADLDGTYHYYFRGQSIIEMRDDNDDVLKQYVWGQNYIDELVQIAVNTNPTTDDTCETVYYTMHDANFNVLGVVDDEGILIERYEYSPYGERTVFISAGSNDPSCTASTLISQRIEISGTNQPYGLCDVGHQGLFHDEETGLINNRARILHSTLGRFIQRDPLGYVDGMSLYAGYHIMWNTWDPWGLQSNPPWPSSWQMREQAFLEAGDTESYKRLRAERLRVETGSAYVKIADDLISETAEPIARVVAPDVADAVDVTSSLSQGKVGEATMKAGIALIPGALGEAVKRALRGAGALIRKCLWGAKNADNAISASRSVSRALTEADLGVKGTISELKGTLSVENGVARARIDMIRGNVENPFEIINNLSNTARANGATTLQIEGTLANERLYNILKARYGLTSEGATDVITIPLGAK